MKQVTLKELRLKNKLTQKEVANEVQKTITYISLLEAGKRNPSDKLKEKLAKLYNVSINEIFLAIKLTKCKIKMK